jgi:1-acyl-sn-glycerol-3-phosphate acyltransferase
MVLRSNQPERPKPTALWRITIPAWALAFVLMAFVVLPLRWLVVGEYTLPARGRAFQWVRTWHQRIFPWPKH